MSGYIGLSNNSEFPRQELVEGICPMGMPMAQRVAVRQRNALHLIHNTYSRYAVKLTIGSIILGFLKMIKV